MQPAAQPGDRRDCLEVVRAALPNFEGTARAVARYLLAHAWEVRGMTVVDLAAGASVSPNAVIRFCQALGYAGYREFSHELALSLGQAGQRSFSIPAEALDQVAADLTTPGLVRRMFDLEAQALRDTAQHLSDTLIERAVSALAGAQRVVFGAMGGTAPLAELGAFRLLMYGIDAHWTSDPYATLASAGLLGAGDVALGISHSGQSRLAIEFLQYARERGATSIALTAVPGSPITAGVDIVLAVFGPDVELSPGMQRFASRLTSMALVEALVTAVALRRFGGEPEQLALNRAKLLDTLEPSVVRPYGRRSHRPSGNAGNSPVRR